MRLYQLTLATILQRKSWVIFALMVLLFPFLLPYLTSASEKPLLVQPARVLAAWNILWYGVMMWVFFTASNLGHENAKSGVGEYFLTTGVSKTKQLVEIWLAVLTYFVPLVVATACVCQWGAQPKAAVEQAWWLVLNGQYAVLVSLVAAPLVALAIALSSRFGSVAGFASSVASLLYGLWGTSYINDMLKTEDHPLLRLVWWFSPQYRWADLTNRLHFKDGALASDVFVQLLVYFGGIGLLILAVSRICFRCKKNS